MALQVNLSIGPIVEALELVVIPRLENDELVLSLLVRHPMFILEQSE